MRITRLLAPLAIAASVAFPQANASAVNTLTFTFPILCTDDGGVASNELAYIQLPSGTYAVVVTGACTVTSLGFGTSAGTPCSVPVAGNIPCAGANAGNLPWGVCGTSAAGATTDCASGLPGARLTACGLYSTRVAGDCVNGAGLVYHDGGPMTTEFVDFAGYYGDNLGALLVTVVWTPP